MKDGERLKAIVLRRTDYAEADRVLQLLTPQGRRAVIAKGVRRERSKLAGGIELLALCDVVIRSGRGELGLLTSARLSAFYRHILEDYERMQRRGFICSTPGCWATSLISALTWPGGHSRAINHICTIQAKRP